MAPMFLNNDKTILPDLETTLGRNWVRYVVNYIAALDSLGDFGKFVYFRTDYCIRFSFF